MTRNNDVDMRDYRKVVKYITALICLLVFEGVCCLSSWNPIGLLFAAASVPAIQFAAKEIISEMDSPTQRLAKQDFKNNYLDDDVYNTCPEYKETWDRLDQEAKDRQEQENNKLACKKAIKRRMKE